MSGFEADKLKTLLVLLLAYPLSLVHVNLGSTTAKHLFSATTGIFLAQFVFGSAWIHSFISAIVVYVCMLALPRRRMPVVVFVFTMLYLTLSHLYRVWVDYMGWTLDHTGPQMILTIKLSALAYDYFDGTVDKVEGYAEVTKLTPRDAEARKARRARSISELPSLLAFLGYVYHFGSFFAGPAFFYRHYIDSVTGAVYTDAQGKRLPGGALPGGRLAVATKCFLTSVVCMVVFVVVTPRFDSSTLHTEERLSMPILSYTAYAWVSLIVLRTKYYFGWLMAEGACVLGGIGFRGYDAKTKAPRWDAVNNIDIVGFELAPSVRELARAWNRLTQQWLQFYVYERVPAQKLVVTYFVSAFWHGFYPGYYLFFLSVVIPQEAGRLTFRKIWPHFDPEQNGSLAMLKPVYDVLCIITTSIGINYLVTSFVALSLERAIAIWSRLFFFWHVVYVLAYVVLSVVPAKRKPKQT